MKTLWMHLVRVAAMIAIGAIILPDGTDFWKAILFYFSLIIFAEMSALIVVHERR